LLTNIKFLSDLVSRPSCRRGQARRRRGHAVAARASCALRTSCVRRPANGTSAPGRWLV